VLGLRRRCCLLLFLVISGGLSLWLGSGLLLWLLWLLWCLILQALVDEGKGPGDSRVDRLVVNSLVPTGEVGVCGTPLLAKDILETAGHDASSEQIGKSDALASQESVVQEVLLNNADGLLGGLGGFINALLVVGVAANKGAEPSADGGQNLAVEERQPLQDGSIAMAILAEIELTRLQDTYSCLVLPRRVVFSFWEVTVSNVSQVRRTIVNDIISFVEWCSELE
jgi:hypothetical protein